MVQALTCETPFFLNYGHHPLSVPGTSLPNPCQPSASGDWLKKQQEVVELKKEWIP